MITGFNTDVVFEGVTYHVQTEDKGLDTPLILSLVYNRGTILASKRSPYNDLLTGNFSEKELAERLQRQHKLICAAIRAGRIEDLKQMNAKDSAAKKQTSASIAKKESKIETVTKITPQIEVKTQIEVKVEQKTQEISPQNLLEKEVKEAAPIKKPQIELPKPQVQAKPELKVEKTEKAEDTPIKITDADLIFEDTQSSIEVTMLPDEAVEIITAFSQAEESVDNQLFIELLNEVTFKGGQSTTVSIMVGRGKEQNALVGANVMIKVLGSNFRPLIFHTKTDSNGVAVAHLQIPPFSRGRAAILMKATSNGEEAELRRVIHPG